MNEQKIVMVVLGTRPEAIKLAPVIHGLLEHRELKCLICVTAQHREMLDQELEVFGIKPDIDSNLMRPKQNLAEFTALAIEKLYGVFSYSKPDLVLVQGDTSTVLCATLAAFYSHIPVAHVEAGLRTGNFAAPWPEEANRVLTSRLASLHFAPTIKAQQNLIKEGTPPSSVYVTGNTVVDALLYIRQRVRDSSGTACQGIENIANIPSNSKVVLITGHRRENFGEGFAQICWAISDLADRFPEIHFVYPVHLNPNVREPVDRILKERPRQNIHLIDPLSYVNFVYLMDRSYFILTDSGGIQEEAPTLGKPVLVMRGTTERPEAIEAGTAKLVGTNRNRIVAEASHLLIDSAAYQKMSYAHNPYGDGHATNRIIEACVKFLAI